MSIKDNLSDRLGLDIDEAQSVARERLSARSGELTERLALATRGTAAQPRGENRDQSQTGFFGFGYTSSSDDTADYVDPPDDLDEYWELYRDFALVREPLNNFASEVTEPGVRVEADNEELQSDLAEWSDMCGIRAGELGQSLTGLLADIVVQRRVRGTAVMEKAGSPDSPDGLAGLILHNPDSFRSLTRSGQSILLLPDDPPDPEGGTTPTDETACYLQYPDSLGYKDKQTIPFSQNDLVKFSFDADVGDIWGEPLLASIYERVQSLNKKLRDSDAAIEMKGHPHHIYQLPWGREQAKQYRQQHERGQFTSGQKDFVPQGVEVQVVSGETADIEFAVKTDLEHIFASLPVPKYFIGFETDINQFVTEAQEKKYNRLVEEERRYLENKFEPIFIEKAEELAASDDTNYGLDVVDSVNFEISQPPDENPLRREEFDAAQFKAVVDAWASAGVVLPKQLIAWFMGVNIEEVEQHLRTERTEDALEELTLEDMAEPDMDDLPVDALDELNLSVDGSQPEADGDSSPPQQATTADE